MAQPMFRVVSEEEAKQVPYPYVYVNDDGSARELHEAERKFLEEPFSPFDGGRPYTKESFESRDGWGRIKGFCPRKSLPPGISILPAPIDDPNPPISSAEYVEYLKSLVKAKLK